jgi:hypothetical protein
MVSVLRKSFAIDFAVLVAGQERRCFVFLCCHEPDAVCVVNDPVENGVGDCGLSDHGVSLGDGELRGDQCGFPTIAFLEDLQQIKTLLVVQCVSAPNIKDQ